VLCGRPYWEFTIGWVQLGCTAASGKGGKRKRKEEKQQIALQRILLWEGALELFSAG